jgi:hypothetical protein
LPLPSALEIRRNFRTLSAVLLSAPSSAAPESSVTARSGLRVNRGTGKSCWPVRDRYGFTSGRFLGDGPMLFCELVGGLPELVLAPPQIDVLAVEFALG